MLSPMRRGELAAIALSLGLATTGRTDRVQAANPTKSTPISMKDRTEAKRLFNQAHLAYKNGDYEEAILKWQQSYELSKEPLIFESIANGYERLGNMRHALENLKLWRQAAPSREQATLDGRIQRLEGRVKTEDEEKLRQELEQRQRDEAQKKLDDDARRVREENARAASTGTILGWSLLGAGSIFAITGIALDVSASTDRPIAARACTFRAGAHLCLDSERSAIEQTNALAIAGDAGWIAGAAVGTAGLVILIASKHAKTSDSSSSIAATPWLAPSSGGAFLRGYF